MKNFDLLKQIDQRFVGVIWLTQTPMSLYTDTGQMMNYLSNGLLGSSYKHHTSLKSHEFVCTTKQFGAPFFICHKEVKGALSTKVSNFEVIENLISKTKNSRNDIGEFSLGIICEGAGINSEPLITQCSQALSQVNIQLLN